MTLKLNFSHYDTDKKLANRNNFLLHYHSYIREEMIFKTFSHKIHSSILYMDNIFLSGEIQKKPMVTIYFIVGKYKQKYCLCMLFNEKQT